MVTGACGAFGVILGNDAETGAYPLVFFAVLCVDDLHAPCGMVGAVVVPCGVCGATMSGCWLRSLERAGVVLLRGFDILGAGMCVVTVDSGSVAPDDGWGTF